MYQEMYNTGHSPNAIPTMRIPQMQTYEPPSPINRSVGMSNENPIDISSESGDELIMVDRMGGPIRSVKHETYDFGPIDLDHWPNEPLSVEPSGDIDWLEISDNQLGAGAADQYFDEDWMGERDSFLDGGWPTQVPGGIGSLPGAVRSYAAYISNDPTKTLEEIKSLLENIRPDMEIPPENREGTPAAMVYPLMEHQKVGLTWLKMMEESKTKGGILADDM